MIFNVASFNFIILLGVFLELEKAVLKSKFPETSLKKVGCLAFYFPVSGIEVTCQLILCSSSA